eukprot:1732173-Pyramimonas_sp.AAC.1
MGWVESPAGAPRRPQQIPWTAEAGPKRSPNGPSAQARPNRNSMPSRSGPGSPLKSPSEHRDATGRKDDPRRGRRKMKGIE